MRLKVVQFKTGFGLLLAILILMIVLFVLFNIILIIIPIALIIGVVIWFRNLFKKKKVKKDYIDVEFRIK